MSISTAIRRSGSIGQVPSHAAEFRGHLRGQTVLRNPTKRQVADCLGFNEGIDQQEMRDVIIVGAGRPALVGRIRASRAPSARGRNERTWRPGGFQFKNRELFGISDRYIRTGACGPRLPQAQKFGAEMMIARRAVKLTANASPMRLKLMAGARLPARTIIHCEWG